MHLPSLLPRDTLPGDNHGGWAIRRNGSCEGDTEQSCGGARWAVGDYEMLACCPKTVECPANQHPINPFCCPGSSDCTAEFSLPKTARCANASWAMFDQDGYFCCEEGDVGFNTNSRLAVGCLKEKPQNITYEVLTEVPQHTPTSATATSAAVKTSSAAPSQTSSAGNPGSGTDAGAIAGGTVGGVVGGILIGAGLYWLWRRRRRPKRPAPPEAVSSWGELPAESKTKKKKEEALELSELMAPDQPSQAARVVQELPAH